MNTPPLQDGHSPIAAVERDTGLGKDTLRVWERRYGFPQPLRDARGDRLYPAEQVERLHLIKRLLDQGARPGSVVPAGLEELRQRLGPVTPDDLAAAAATTPFVQDISAELLELLRHSQADALRAALQQQVLRHGVQQFVLEILPALNERVGSGWMTGELSVADEHLYTEQVQNVLRNALNHRPQTPGSGIRQPRVLLTTLPKEQHSLGLLMVEVLLASEGADCVSLGIQTPVQDIRNAALRGEFDVVALSFSAAFPERQALAGLRLIRAGLPPEIEIWAGGQAVGRRRNTLENIRVVPHIRDTLAVLGDWRTKH